LNLINKDKSSFIFHPDTCLGIDTGQQIIKREFLGALGENVLVEQIERLTVPQSVHSYVMDLFRKIKG